MRGQRFVLSILYLPLKASNKDNYRGITLFFSFFAKYLLLDHIECIAQEQSYFSDLQFGFSKGVGCVEASYIISETVNQAEEQGQGFCLPS